MKKALLAIGILLGGFIAVFIGIVILLLRVFNPERRKNIARSPGRVFGWIMDHVPDN